MERELGVTQAREAFSELIEQVQFRGDAYIINKHGKPAAAVVPVQVYENWKRQRADLFDQIREMQEAAALDSKEAAGLAEEAVAAIRAQD